MSEGRVVVITGSSRGIGRETARLFLEKGDRVVLNGRDAERLAQAQQELDPEGQRTLAVAGDATSTEDVGRLVSETIETWGRMDVLVCSAGLMMRGRFADLTAEVVDQVMRVNVLGVTLPIVESLPELEKTRGSILIVSSLAGLRGMPHINIYCASKMALTAVAESLWIELDGKGVHVGILHVGITENDADKQLLAADGSKIQVTRGSHSTQADVARAVYKQVARRKRRVIMTPAGKALDWVHWLAPGLLTRIIARAQKTTGKLAS